MTSRVMARAARGGHTARVPRPEPTSERLFPPSTDAHGVGVHVRAWRLERRWSQEALAAEAGVSTRHLSCVETGRAQPSRELVVRLADVLDVPHRERNVWLAAAGFAPMFRETDYESPEMAPVRRAVDFLLERHAPYGAVAVDSAWTVRRANAGAVRLLSTFSPTDDPALLSNLLRLTLHPAGLRGVIDDWPSLARLVLERTTREALTEGPSGPAARVLREVRAYPGVAELASAPRFDEPSALVVPLTLRRGGLVLRLMSTITTLGTPVDVTAQELRVETWFPADAAAEAWWAEGAT
jgi:transcriptional regulator with XRE-family HTH domain